MWAAFQLQVNSLLQFGSSSYVDMTASNSANDCSDVVRITWVLVDCNWTGFAICIFAVGVQLKLFQRHVLRWMIRQSCRWEYLFSIYLSIIPSAMNAAAILRFFRLFKITGDLSSFHCFIIAIFIRMYSKIVFFFAESVEYKTEDLDRWAFFFLYKILQLHQAHFHVHALWFPNKVRDFLRNAAAFFHHKIPQQQLFPRFYNSAIFYHYQWKNFRYRIKRCFQKLQKNQLITTTTKINY